MSQAIQRFQIKRHATLLLLIGLALITFIVSFQVSRSNWGSAFAFAPGVVAAFGFSETSGLTTADASGNANTATMVGGVTRITTGKFGNALRFNGSNAALRIPDSPTWKVNGLTGYTISLWVKVNSATGDYKPLIGKGAWPSSDLLINKTGSTWEYRLRTTALNCGGITTPMSYLATVDNTYHHIALVLNAAQGNCQFYSDGVVVGADPYVSGTTIFETGTGVNNLFIGGLDGGGQYLNADIDEVRLYTRALSLAELQADMTTPVDGAPLPDTTPPVISAVTAGSITTTGATISWTTNEAADTQVEYGTTTAYGQSTTLAPALTTAHTQALSGLTAGTLYNYRVKSKDAAGNLATSANFTFTTAPPPDTTPPVISAVLSSGLTATGATISWATNEPANSQVEFGTTTAYGSLSPLNATLATTHSHILSGLTASTLYHYRVRSRDAAGNLATSANFTFTTPAPPPDTTPPVISAVIAGSLTTTGATISWTTNEMSDTQVEYGLTTAYGLSTTLAPALTTAHTQALSGLTAGTLYNYRVKSKDAAGNLATSANFTFTTAPPPDTTPPVLSVVTAGSIGATGATITWNTNEAADTQVEYGLTTAYGQTTTLVPALTTAHSQALSGLTPATLYHYRVKSKDAAGNLATSADFTFTTSAAPPLTNYVAGYGFSEASGLTTADASGNLNTGTLVGGVSRIVAGKYGGGLSFNGSNGAVRIADSPSWKVSGSTTYTLSFWIKVKSGSGDYKMAIGTGAWPPQNIYIYRVGTTWVYGMRTSALACGGVTSALSYLTTVDNAYHHVALVVNTTAGNCNLYSDGVVVGTDMYVSGTTAFLTGPGLNDLYLGGLAEGQYLNADIDEVRLYTRALTAGEIQADMATPVDGAGPPDSTPPVLSGVSLTGLTNSGVTILWTTNEAADSRVEYGTTTAYGSSTILNPNLDTEHSQVLTALTPNTLYHYRVHSKDAAGNAAVSGDFTFTTPLVTDVTPPVISGVGSTGLTTTTATINWTTNEAADSRVEYGTTTAYGSSTILDTGLVTSHTQGLTGLSPNTLYNYRVHSKDAAGNATISTNFRFTTSPLPDTIPPVISAVSSSGIFTTGATISWTTDERSDSRIEYGTTTAYGAFTTLAPALVYSHTQMLSGLTLNTLYHYRVHSKDAAGNATVSADFTFTTALIPDTTLPVISAVGSSGITTTAALITWTTGELSDSRVEYGTTTAYGSSTALDASFVTAHSRTLAGLTPSTLYHYRVRSKDPAGNEAVSADFIFTSAAPLPLPPAATVGTADPTLLPLAAGQATPATTPVVEGGASYLDPVSGVRIWRATSESYPCAGNTGLRAHDYGDTNQISHEWGTGFQTILIRTCGEYRLVDFKRGVGFSNWRMFATDASPDSDLSFVFSNNPATPQIAYILRDGNLNRYNTATNQIENTGNFPKLGWGARGWLQNDLTDTWFVANNAATPGCKAWNSVTNESRERTIPEYDECHLENRGRYVVLNTGNGGDSVWDLQTDTVKPFDPPTGHIFHMASPSGYFTAVDVNTGLGRTPYYRMDPATGTGTLIYDNAQNGYDNTVFHHSGNWVNQAVPDEQQWFLTSTYGTSVAGAFLPRAIGFMRLDGSEIRFLAHSYNEIVDYWQIPRAMVAPNGKLVVFDSEFRGLNGGDVYVVEVPIR